MTPICGFPAESSANATFSLGRDLSLTFHAPLTAMGSHRHRHSYVSLVLRGGYREETQSGAQELRRGDLVIHPPEERHANTFGPIGAICLNINEAGIRSAAFADVAWPTLTSRRMVRGAPFSVGRALGDFLTGSGSTGVLLSSIGAALRHSLGATAADPAELEWIERLDAIIDRTFREPVGLAVLAARVSLSPGHVARRYRAVRGRTIGQRVRQLRCEWAMHRIVGTKLPLSVIAADAGFADQSHLTRSIRTYCGRTPASLR